MTKRQIISLGLLLLFLSLLFHGLFQCLHQHYALGITEWVIAFFLSLMKHTKQQERWND